MTVEKIEGTKRRKSVWADGEIAFVCSETELRQFQIEEGKEIPEREYEYLKLEALLPRAKRRAMYLLQAGERSEAELREKLKTSHYPEDVVEQALGYVKEYHYIDDARYAENFVRARMTSKSRREITQQLRQKGITPELIERAFETVIADYQELEDTGEEPEMEAIRHYLEKKGVGKKELDYKEKQKLAAALFRKGFKMEHIRKAIALEEEN